MSSANMVSCLQCTGPIKASNFQSSFVQMPQVRSLSTGSVGEKGAFDKRTEHKKCRSCTCTTCSNKIRLMTTTSDKKLQQEASLKKEIETNVKKAEEGKFDTIPDPAHLEHFKKKSPQVETSSVNQSASVPSGVYKSSADQSSVNQSASNVVSKSKDDEVPMGVFTLPHPIWSDDDVQSVKITHTPPEGIIDHMAYFTVKLLRGGFDIFSGFKRGERDEFKWVKRIIFLETVAGVPGMVAAMMRHMISLRRMQRDHGWIHTLLEEAENERMHLMTALQLKQPSWMFRMAVIGSQGVFVSLFSLWYIISPRFCHRFVGYLEEEAVKTYTKCLEDIRDGPMKHWQTKPAPEVAIRYWKLPADAKMLEVILAIRADEAHHRVVNHTLASMKSNQFNPYKPGQ